MGPASRLPQRQERSELTASASLETPPHATSAPQPVQRSAPKAPLPERVESHSIPVPGRGTRASLRARLLTQQLERRSLQPSPETPPPTRPGSVPNETDAFVAGSPAAIAHSYVEYATSFGPYGTLSRSAQNASSSPEQSLPERNARTPRQTPGAPSSAKAQAPANDAPLGPVRTASPRSRSSSPLSSSGPVGIDGEPASWSYRSSPSTTRSVPSNVDEERGGAGHPSPHNLSIEDLQDIASSRHLFQHAASAEEVFADLSVEERRFTEQLASRLVAPALETASESAGHPTKHSRTLSDAAGAASTTGALPRDRYGGDNNNNNNNKPRIVFLGRRNCGKTSLHSVVFHQTSAHETLFLESTSRIVAHDVTYSPWISCQLVDTPGIDTVFWEHASRGDTSGTADSSGPACQAEVATEEHPQTQRAQLPPVESSTLNGENATLSESLSTEPASVVVVDASCREDPRDAASCEALPTERSVSDPDEASPSMSASIPTQLEPAAELPAALRTLLDAADALVYVIDSSTTAEAFAVDELQRLLAYWRTLCRTGDHRSTRYPHVWVCLHKADLANSAEQEQTADALGNWAKTADFWDHWYQALGCCAPLLLQNDSRRSPDDAAHSFETPTSCTIEDVCLQVWRTSIYDDSCVQSMANLLRALLPQLLLLQRDLEAFVQDSGVSGAFVFDTFTRLCLAEVIGTAAVSRYRALAAEWTLLAREWSLTWLPSEPSKSASLVDESPERSAVHWTGLVDAHGEHASMQLSNGDQLCTQVLSPVLVLVYVQAEASSGAEHTRWHPGKATETLDMALASMRT
jgi:hypothetical protein